MKKKQLVITSIAIVIIIVLLTPLGMAEAKINSVSSSPRIFNPAIGETIHINVIGDDSMTGLLIHIFNYNSGVLIRSNLLLTEEAVGEYSTNWDGKTDEDTLANPALYIIKVFDSINNKYFSLEIGYVTVGEAIPM